MHDMTIPTAITDSAPTAARHPRGLTVLATTELWERFSFYGMQALLMLYMTTRLVPLAEHGGVWGWAALRNGLQSVIGPLSDQAYASQIFGLYTGLVYLTPLAGGMLGDRVLGRRQTVLLGGALMAAGHFLLAVEAAFLPALLLLILGSGCLKGNIATQVGALYAPADHRRDQAYLLFNLGINLGAFAGPLVCGLLGEQGNWHIGFAMAGVGMLVGLVIYVTGWRNLPLDTRPATIDAPSDRQGRIGVLLALVVLSAFYNIPVGQGYNVFPLWIDAAANRHLGGFTIPVSWYLASDGLVTVLASPLVVMLWKRQTERGTLPPVALRIGMGCAAMAAADGLLAAYAHFWPGPHGLGPLAGFAYFLLASSAYLYVMPVLLAAVAGAAPPRLTATMMGTAYAGLFFANLTGGWLARFYQPWGAERFWAFHAAIAATGVIVAVIARRPLSLPDERA